MFGYTVFHKDIMNSLIDTVRRGKSANAYIFEGDAGLAVNDAAELFAKSLMCMEQESAPCGSCATCEAFSSGADPDLVYVRRPKDKATIGVDAARKAMIEAMSRPLYSKRRVFIFDEGDMLTAEAQNVMLKVLEEPPEYAVFIIVCNNGDNILQTVRSRSVVIEFPPVSDDIVREYIEEKYPDNKDTEFLVSFCAGIPMTADAMIAREDLEALREETLNIIPRFLSANKVYAYDAAAFFEKNKDNAEEICDMLLMYLRDALVTSLCGGDIVNIDKAEKIGLIASSYTPSVIAAGADEVMMMKKMLQKHIKPSVAALHAALKI